MDPFTMVLLLMLGFAVLLVAGIGRRGAPTDAPPVLPRLVAGGALVGALLAGVVGVVAIVMTFIGDRVTLAVPIIPFIETVPDALRATPGVSIVGGSAQQVSVPLSLSGLDPLTLTLVALQTALTTAVIITVLLMVARLAKQSLSETPFSPKASSFLAVSGIAFTLGVMASQFAGLLAGARAHEQLFFLRTDAIDGVVNAPPTWVIEVWPIGVGLVLIVLARLIRGGERLQRDTKGLV
ncbi:hypothetical protein [Microcella sp.]|uniref:hypothetical protein n=1 Tax=Microcella sp. TaxID=1913979 RepID=UPI0039190097